MPLAHMDAANILAVPNVNSQNLADGNISQHQMMVSDPEDSVKLTDYLFVQDGMPFYQSYQNSPFMATP